MEGLVRGFEQQLKQRLAQKTTTHQSEESQLAKYFKYFDLNNSGHVGPVEFGRVLEKLGVWMGSAQDVTRLYQHYDVNSNNQLDYNEFIGILYNAKNKDNSRVQSARPESRAGDFSQAKLNAKDIQSLLDKLRSQFYGRGGKTILGLGRQFRIMDDNGNRCLCKEEFIKGMHDYGVTVDKNELAQLYSHFDRNNDGRVNFDELLVVIRGPMNNFRQALVVQAFRKLDKTGNGQVDIEDLIDVYSVEKHPDFINGKMTKEQILRDFMHTFEQYSDLRGIGDGVITEEEFKDYYNFISASIDNDQYFELMMNNCWRINSGDNDTWNKKGWADKGKEANLQTAFQQNQSNAKRSAAPFGTDQQPHQPQPTRQAAQGLQQKQGVELLMRLLRKKIASRGTNGIFSLGRLFRNMDDNGNHVLCLAEFSKCMTEFRLGFQQSDVQLVFDHFDRDGNDRLSYDEFLRGVRGEMNQGRVKVVRQAFNKLDADKSGVVDLTDIKEYYNARQHPDVRQGKKTEEQVLGEFLDTFEQHHALQNPNNRDGQVHFEEFVEYYNNISSSIDNDEYFELMVKNAWQLDGHNRAYGRGWANDL